MIIPAHRPDQSIAIKSEVQFALNILFNLRCQKYAIKIRDPITKCKVFTPKDTMNSDILKILLKIPITPDQGASETSIIRSPTHHAVPH